MLRSGQYFYWKKRPIQQTKCIPPPWNPSLTRSHNLVRKRMTPSFPWLHPDLIHKTKLRGGFEPLTPGPPTSNRTTEPIVTLNTMILRILIYYCCTLCKVEMNHWNNHRYMARYDGKIKVVYIPVSTSSLTSKTLSLFSLFGCLKQVRLQDHSNSIF